VLAEHAGIDLTQWLKLDPDIIKQEMAARGMIPDVPGLSPMEAASLVHDESSRVTHILADRARAQKRNVIWDITMSDEDSAKERLTRLRADGYSHVHGIFVDVPLAVAQRRALNRYQDAQDVWLAEGTGHGGRYIPADELRKIAGDEPVSRCRRTFDALRDHFDLWEIWDNSRDGQPPLLLESSTGDPSDLGGPVGTETRFSYSVRTGRARHPVGKRGPR
jgi:hypothetical protein